MSDNKRSSVSADRMREQAAMRAALPKKFYSAVSTAQGETGFNVLLDGRIVKTPGKKVLALPTESLAQAVALEWDRQDGVIDPATMPLTRIANTAIEAVSVKMAEVEADIVAFAGSDLLCYRAAGPEMLVVRQSKAWDPVVQWAADALGARFILGEGVMPISQPPSALDSIARAVTGLGPFRLAGLHVATTLTGSALLALAVLKEARTAEQAWAAAHVDEDYQIELWGSDTEAVARRAQRWADMQAASRMLTEG